MRETPSFLLKLAVSLTAGSIGFLSSLKVMSFGAYSNLIDMARLPETIPTIVTIQALAAAIPFAVTYGAISYGERRLI